MVAPFCTFFYPLTERIYLFFTEGGLFVRHPLFGVGFGETFNHFTAVRVARNDGRFATFVICQGILSEQQTKIALPLHAAMADNAFAIKQRLYLRIKVNLVVGKAVRKGVEHRHSDETNKCIFCSKDFFHDELAFS